MNVNVPWAWQYVGADLEYRETGSDEASNTTFWTRERHMVVRRARMMAWASSLHQHVLGPSGWAMGQERIINGAPFIVTGDEAAPEESSTSWLLVAQTLERFTKWKKVAMDAVGSAGDAGEWGLVGIREQSEYRETGSDEPNNTTFWSRTQATLTRWREERVGFDLRLGHRILGPTVIIAQKPTAFGGLSFTVTGQRFAAENADFSLYRHEQSLERYSPWVRRDHGKAA